MTGSDHDSGVLFLLATRGPLVVFPLNSDRLVVLVEIPLLFRPLFFVEATKVIPPVVIKNEGTISLRVHLRERLLLRFDFLFGVLLFQLLLLITTLVLSWFLNLLLLR